MIAGRNFLSFEYSPKEYVILLDNLTAQSLFGNEKNAIGREVEISKRRRGMNLSYRVVGVFRNPLESFIRVMRTGFFPRFARIPYQNYNHVFDNGSGVFTDILIEAKNPEDLGREMQAAKNYLERRKDRKSTRLNSSHANISYAV